MRFSKRQFDESYAYENFLLNRGSGQYLGYVIEIEGDYYAVFDGRQNKNCPPEEDVWLVKDYASRDPRSKADPTWNSNDNFVSLFFRSPDGIFVWEYDHKGELRKFPHPRADQIRDYPLRDAIMNVMGYW